LQACLLPANPFLQADEYMHARKLQTLKAQPSVVSQPDSCKLPLTQLETPGIQVVCCQLARFLQATVHMHARK
jgi:hypothetical protein